MRIGILGSGLMGGKLGTIFARAGHAVVFSYSRDRKKLEQLARDAGGDARAGTPREATKDAVFDARGSGTPPSMLYCGDDDDAKEIVAGLVRDVGFDPADVGPL